MGNLKADMAYFLKEYLIVPVWGVLLAVFWMTVSVILLAIGFVILAAVYNFFFS